jgi:glutamine amidotransferase
VISVIDYGMGNLKSLCNALDYLGLHTTLAKKPEDLAHAERIICPGVGSFNAAVSNLHNRALFARILEVVNTGVPFFGICLGMQLLATRGFEHGESEGLGLIPGVVERMQPLNREPLPHVGWNEISLRREHPILKGLKENLDFYFVHSYCFRPEDEGDIVASSEYGGQFASFVARKNIVGVQFHPEKSQESGLKLLANFGAWNGTC